jgi:hypothetical protein
MDQIYFYLPNKFDQLLLKTDAASLEIGSVLKKVDNSL